MALDQMRAGLHEIARLGVIEPDGADMAAKPFFSHGQDGLGGIGVAEESFGGLIDAFVVGLRGEDHRDQQFEGSAECEFAGRVGVLRSETGEDLAGTGGGWILIQWGPILCRYLLVSWSVVR